MMVGMEVCSECRIPHRTDEMEHYNHGPDCEGWLCEPCQKLHKEIIEDSWKRFQATIKAFRESPAKPITFDL